MKVGVVMPVLNQYELAIKALESVKTQYTWTPYIIPQYRERLSLSGAWNQGVQRATDDGCDFIAIINDDIILSPWTLDGQIEFFKESEEDNVILTTAWSQGDQGNPEHMLNYPKPEHEGAWVPGADFSCFMIVPATTQIVGTFDENLFPAYFEDNDYHRRLLMLGYSARIVTQAPYFHYGSRSRPMDTIANDINFKRCEEYYLYKWGGGPGAEIYPTPYNDPNLTPKDWDPERNPWV